MLTGAEQKQLDKYLSEWREFGAKPSEKRLERLHASILAIYSRMGLKEPLIIRCNGPLEQLVLPALVHLMIRAGKVASSQIKFEPMAHEPAVVREEWLNLWTVAFESIDWKSAEQFDGIGPSLRERIKRKIQNTLVANLTGIVDEQYGMEKNERLERLVRIALQRPFERLFPALRFQEAETELLWKSFVKRLPLALHSDLQKTLNEQAEIIERSQDSQSEALLPFTLNAPRQGEWSTGLDWYPLAGPDFAQKHLQCPIPDRLRQQLEQCLPLGMDVTAALFCRNYCFLFVKPIEAFFDEQLRLHHPKKAAVHFVDGTKFFFWHGREVDEEIITHPNKITMKMIESEGNAEIRRVLIDRYGLDNFIKASSAKKIHEDRYGVLYRKDLPNDEPVVVVKVLNSTPEPDGSHKFYFLRVPPEIETAREAVAWTFGMSADDYKPDIES